MNYSKIMLASFLGVSLLLAAAGPARAAADDPTDVIEAPTAAVAPEPTPVPPDPLELLRQKLLAAIDKLLTQSEHLKVKFSADESQWTGPYIPFVMSEIEADMAALQAMADEVKAAETRDELMQLRADLVAHRQDAGQLRLKILVRTLIMDRVVDSKLMPMIADLKVKLMAADEAGHDVESWQTMWQEARSRTLAVQEAMGELRQSIQLVDLTVEDKAALRAEIMAARDELRAVFGLIQEVVAGLNHM